MESLFSISLATVLVYAFAAILSLGAAAYAGCLMSRTIRQSGACTFLWQEESREGAVRHD